MVDHIARSDVLIVGAGSAGSVLAERLSADPARRVTVLEAGPGPDEPGVRELTHNGLQLPIGAASPLAQRYRTSLTDDPRRGADIVRGLTVGGSGAVNGGYFCRALPADFDGPSVPGWSWPEVRPHYRAIQDDLDFPDRADGGPIAIRRTHEFLGSTASFVTAAAGAGLRWLPDLNAEPHGDNAPPGIGAVPLNIVDGVRTGPGAAFLEPAAARPNLTVLTRSRAQRIRISGGRAVAVEVLGPAGPVVVEADRIVLSAGAIGSAHLLMLSGVGPAADLRSAGITVAADLPVGQRTFDHPEWVLPTTWTVAPQRPVLEVVLVMDGLEIRPYTGGFISMVGDGTLGRPDWPHLGVALMTPRGHGRVALLSPDPAVAPLIEHRYDHAPEDVVALRRGCQLASEIFGATTQLGEPIWSTSQHLCGTAPMGTDDDEHAVIDPRCRVRGIDNLWVVDGSVLPRITSRGPHATIAMIGRRAAEFVA
ncbi:mycofactocin system GMC family oxidoreductase MftG [Mycobacterium sp. CVI_P3]|uniref:Mycofactocin system GMC family oxidoreductase MftG n=1 Tax=Mycobacterium pinniadriaticum TaxID=2994102 RepID=A0ABT3SNC2_9MYCO|nr:mycofactocin system GMC family oxidoreductase MftG [Mycobacterium pinniadriaticum]MCX2934574.1 mycofactocin system GMC family oxidoreductase MftG [Mycobacterium pinniadriaticum]MCX2941024.1 mycofactocin system GMC family oxidoreductase MftG [Mycobacterium pinniadriaticum]